MTKTPHTIEEICEALILDIEAAAGECDPAHVTWQGKVHLDSKGLAWFEFNYAAHGEPFPIYARFSQQGAFQSAVDLEDFEYYSA